MPSTQPSPGVMISSIITRLFLPIAAGLFAMLFLPPILALLIGLALGIVINLLFTKIKKNYATFLQFLWFAGTLGYLGVSIPFINKTTPTGSLGIAIGIALVVVCTGERFYSTRTRRSDLSQGPDNLFRFLPIVLFVVVLVGGIIRLPITTINGSGWNSGGGVIVWVILSVIIAILISAGLAGVYMTIVFTWRGIRESLGFVYLPVIINPPVRKHKPGSQLTQRDISIGYDPDELRRKQEAQAKYQQQEDDTKFNEHMKPQRFALLHIAHRRRKLLPTLASGKCKKQEPVAPHPMPWGPQDGRRYRVGQVSHRPGWLGIVDTRLGVFHRFALVL